jgi:hypothetical protein
MNKFTQGDNFMDFLKDLFGFLKARKKYWLLPIVIVLLIFGSLIVLTSGTAVAPFIYTLF